jgi:arsenate reductase|tara:strand:+ start:1305 stop:1937 length:633 start_codon:yes stop_codon:yes gene_type:complete
MLKTSTTSTKNFFENAGNTVSISKERAQLLGTIAENISKEYQKNGTVNLNFICTHNSRRSQFGQVWSFFAAEYFNLNIHAFSGGTEVTAFFKNTVKTLASEGFNFEIIDFSHQNPKYAISFEGTDKTIFGFSKLFNDAQNLNPFIAITTCNNADENCPFIPTATHRFHLPFVDPKFSDETEAAHKTYEKTSQQIAGELFFMFTKVSDLLG